MTDEVALTLIGTAGETGDPARFAAPARTGAQMPVPGPDIELAAREAPDHWLMAVDRAWTASTPPPPWALIGQWRSDATGTVVEWVDNPEHRPGPEFLGWPDPTDDIDALVQRLACGYADPADLVRGIRTAPLEVVVDASGKPAGLAAPDGTPVVAVYSSPAQVAGAWLTAATTALDLAATAPADHLLYLNSGSMTPIVLDTSQLAEQAAG